MPAPQSDARSEEGSVGLPELGENIDTATFEQILEMDDDEEEREFSRSIVFDFFQQAEATFQKMDENLYAILSPPPSPFPLTFPSPSQERWGRKNKKTKQKGGPVADECPPPHSEKRDLAQLSALGHFLKGSSATLGLTKVKDSCEKIQHYGANKDETGTRDEPDDEKCLKALRVIIAQAKEEFREVERALRRFYHDE
ncbi:hypothetical protein MBLNU459_g3484t1 [Dothideomycetes sp. NU459]